MTPRIIGPIPPPGSDVWWRASAKTYTNYDPFAEFEQPSGSHIVIELQPFEVVKYTPKGVWLRGWLGERFFQLGNAIRQRAVPTKEAALQDLVKRKERHLSIMQARTESVRQALIKAENAHDKERFSS